jgi:hypothetical protein
MATSAARTPRLVTANFFTVHMSTATLSHRKSASAQTPCDKGCVRGHDKRDILRINISSLSWMLYIRDVIGPDKGASLSTEIQNKNLVADVTKARIAFIFSVSPQSTPTARRHRPEVLRFEPRFAQNVAVETRLACRMRRWCSTGRTAGVLQGVLQVFYSVNWGVLQGVLQVLYSVY